MKLVTFRLQDKVSWGAVEGDAIIEFGRGLEPAYSIVDALAFGTAEIEEWYSKGVATIPLESVELLPPIPSPGKILCIGLNYADHQREMKRERAPRPTVFARFADTVVGAGEPLIAPEVSESFDYEGELAVVIGRSGRHVPVDRALEMVAGYTLFNDGSIRDYQRHSTQFTPGKNFPRSGAMGPWLVTPDELESGFETRVLTTRLNGAVVQQAPLADMLYSVAELIAYCSEWTELRPGDVIATGTPGGVGTARTPQLWMRPGDTVEVELPGIGLLVNPVVAEVRQAAHTSW
ncbi:fumarylacetoacetate hydrolase family protein [Smaragdicoccus niigatensis]|uniref:fumarylacetoacetate hydrolase family protein n=1 Tax=Smaragdicoccus niigatensis TaxID=359359 RepID=UPI0003635754|nr:fumarylacetoacetate hydrolase family protein [Smaragdicoccus niigatensis]